jgi:hypothetical protein
VALARTNDGTPAAASELASGIAIEVSHWLTQSPDVIVRTPGKVNVIRTTRRLDSYSPHGDYDQLGYVLRNAGLIRGGFFNAPYIAADPLTTALRSQPPFAGLLSEAAERHAAFRALVANERR